MAKSEPRVYQLKIALVGAKPPIWRRFLVEDSIPLDQLHDVVQIVMGWTDSHLHQFVVGRIRYLVPEPDFGTPEDRDEADYTIRQVLKREKDAIFYEYDFGDGWRHKITLERILPPDPERTLPVCVKGKGACPPEDVGGPWGYYAMLEALSDPNHPRREEFVDWIGDDFDPAAFDIDEINRYLAPASH